MSEQTIATTDVDTAEPRLLDAYSLIRPATANPDRLIFRSRDGDYFLKTNPDASTLPGGIQDQLWRRGFPVPEVVDRGTVAYGEGTVPYIIETSAGESFGDLIEGSEPPEDEVVTSYADCVANWLDMQLSNPSPAAMGAFEGSLYLDDMKQEIRDTLSTYASTPLLEQLEAAWNTASARLSTLPFVLNQGDMVPRNVMRNGQVIDFEYALIAPAGYDSVSSLLHTYMFPPDSVGAEASRDYAFTAEQISRSLQVYDAVFKAHGLPALSGYVDDLLIAKMLWSAGGETERPALQAWRWRLLGLALSAYNDDQSVQDILTHQSEALLREKQDIGREIGALALDVFGSDLEYCFIAGGLAREDWRPVSSDIDVFAKTSELSPDQRDRFAAGYLDVHRRHLYSPDTEYPGELVDTATLAARFDRVHAGGKPAIIRREDIETYDAAVWAGMLVQPHAAFVGDALAYWRDKTSAERLRRVWRDAIISDGGYADDNSRHVAEYESDV